MSNEEAVKMAGFADDDVPASTERSYRVGGRVAVTFANGESGGEARCFVARERDGIPMRSRLEAVVNDVAALLPVSSGQGQGDVKRWCTYFEFCHRWYFFYTVGPLPEGARISFTL